MAREILIRFLRQTWLGICILFVASVNTNAQNVSVADAMSKARVLKRSNTISSPSNNTLSGADVNIDLAYTSENKGNTLFYVFNYADGGFAIIGGDEKAKEVLGYSDNGVFNIDSIPEGLKDMLASYSEQISYAIDNNVEVSQMNMSTTKRSIATLIQTTWNQSNPFNSCIPEIGLNYSKFVAGCAPIAAAQIMKYYNYPRSGIGSKSYTKTYNDASNGYTKTITFSADFAKTIYDWDNMRNSYYSSSTSIEQQAVGLLVYHVGVAMNANYGQYATGVYTNADLPALKNYFGYDTNARKEYRSSYSDSEWENLIYNELALERPIFYAGQATDGGHAFVCDGYDSSYDWYHFNWGWGGYCDGYYPLTGSGALQPNGNGIGGAGTGSAYTSDQYALIGLCPPPPEIKVTGITLSQTSTSLTVGETRSLTATITPTNATNKNVTWSSSNANVATVSASGVVTAINAGTATITATATDGSGKNASCLFTVKKKEPSTTVTIMFTSGGVSVYDSGDLSDLQMSQGSSGDKLVINLVSGQQYVYNASEIADIRFEVNDSDNPSSPIDDGTRHNGYEYVDLGLSVKWATMNVGANSPTEAGGYYAWGETETKETYTLDTYLLVKKIEPTIYGQKYATIKYNTDENYGPVDNKTTLEIVDDVASVSWKGKWRMPTDSELTELRTKCNWKQESVNGVLGMRVSSTIPGYEDKSIFLPAGGYKYGDLIHEGVGHFWSSTANQGFSADFIWFHEGTVYWDYFYRYWGRNVRPVLPK